MSRTATAGKGNSTLALADVDLDLYVDELPRALDQRCRRMRELTWERTIGERYRPDRDGAFTQRLEHQPVSPLQMREQPADRLVHATMMVTAAGTR